MGESYSGIRALANFICDVTKYQQGGGVSSASLLALLLVILPDKPEVLAYNPPLVEQGG